MKKFRLSALIIGHTLFLIIFSLLWLNISFSYENESSIISAVSILKNVAFDLETKPSRDSFLLVNVSYQKALNLKTDEFGFEIGNEAITDRESLAQFFNKASSNIHKYIVCDVFLEQPSSFDSLLRYHVNKTRNVIFPYHRVDGEFIKPVMSVPVAFSDYSSDFGSFLKYEFLQHDTCQTIALKMYRDLHHATYENGFLFDYKNGRRVLNSFIIEFPIRQYDIFRSDTLGYNSIHLKNLLELPDELISDMMRNKIIIVGDFLEDDLHQTIYGTTAGPLIHLNAYLNLKNDASNLSVWFFIYLFVVYFIFSYVLIKNIGLTSVNWINKIQKSKLGGFLFDYFKYAFFLLLMSIVSFLIFGIHLNILVISLYFSLAEYVIEYLLSKKEPKQSLV